MASTESHASEPHTTHIDDDSVHLTRANFWNSRITRVSWGAILAGFFSAIAFQLLLSLLGLAIGFWSINPATENAPFSGIGVGTGIWWVVTGLISMFIGGSIAGRLAGRSEKADGMLQGVVVWGLVTVVSFWYAGSTLGTVLNATTDALGSGMSALADYTVPDNSQSQPQNSMAQNSSQSTAQSQSTMKMPNVDYEQISKELNEILKETGAEQLEPEDLDQAYNKLTNVAQDAAATALKRPDTASQQLDRVLGTFFNQSEQFRDALDQKAIANVIAKNSDADQQEAMNMVDRWQNEYQEMWQTTQNEQQSLEAEMQQLGQEIQSEYKDVKQAALQTTDQLMDSVAQAAFWSFLTIFFGLCAAAGGGVCGSPKSETTAMS